MTAPHPPDPTDDDELVSAVLDGEATPEEEARVAADPDLRARLDQFRSVRDAVASPPAPDEVTRQRLLTRALDGAAAVGATTASPPAAPPPPEGADVVAATARSRSHRRRTTVLSAAAAVVLVLLVGAAVLAVLARDGTTTTAADRAASGPTENRDASQAEAGAADDAAPADERATADLEEGSASSPASSIAPGAPQEESDPSVADGGAAAPTPGEAAPVELGVFPDAGSLDAAADAAISAYLGPARAANPATPTPDPSASSPDVAVTTCAEAVRGRDLDAGSLLWAGRASEGTAPRVVLVFLVDPAGGARRYTLDATTCEPVGAPVAIPR